MKLFMSSRVINSALVLVICLVTGLIASGQEKMDKSSVKEAAKYKNKEFCSSSDNWSSNNKESYRELRESTAPGGGLIDVDAGRNGGISVKGENRSDVLVRACVQAWGDTMDAAKAAVSSVSISTGSLIRANGPDESNYSVSFQILVPHSIQPNMRTVRPLSAALSKPVSVPLVSSASSTRITIESVCVVPENR